MATVPHPVPSRTAHDIAALYGAADHTLLAWQRACAQAAAPLHGVHDEERLRKALTLAQDGHVTLEDDGSATVESRGTHYEVQADGACACPDARQQLHGRFLSPPQAMVSQELGQIPPEWCWGVRVGRRHLLHGHHHSLLSLLDSGRCPSHGARKARGSLHHP